jgi:hypothetical protein
MANAYISPRDTADSAISQLIPAGRLSRENIFPAKITAEIGARLGHERLFRRAFAPCLGLRERFSLFSPIAQNFAGRKKGRT